MNKRLDEKEYTYLKLINDEYSGTSNPLNEWEQGFLEEMLEKFEQYGPRLIVSGKQWGIISRIGEKLGL